LATILAGPLITADTGAMQVCGDSTIGIHTISIVLDMATLTVFLEITGDLETTTVGMDSIMATTMASMMAFTPITVEEQVVAVIMVEEICQVIPGL